MKAIQVVGVVQAEPTSSLFELVGGETFERGLSCDRHENGKIHRAVRKMKDSSTGFGSLLYV